MLPFVLVLFGMLGLCLGMPKHYRQMFRVAPRARSSRILKVVGWLTLAAGAAIAMMTFGWAVGLVVWIGQLFLAAMLVAVALAVFPKAAHREHR